MLIHREFKLDPSFERILIAGWHVALSQLKSAFSEDPEVNLTENSWFLKNFDMHSTPGNSVRSVTCEFSGQMNSKSRCEIAVTITYSLGQLPNPDGTVTVESLRIMRDSVLGDEPSSVFKNPRWYGLLENGWEAADEEMARRNGSSAPITESPLIRPEEFGRWS